MNPLDRRLRVLEFRKPRLPALVVAIVRRGMTEAEALEQAQREGQDTNGVVVYIIEPSRAPLLGSPSAS